MRYDAEHKQQTRQRVLKEAAKAIRKEGPHQIGVAGVMARAGLTHGGFYAHFDSKDDLVAAAIGQMFEESVGRVFRDPDSRDASSVVADYIDFYLSPTHRDSRTSGCPLPFLAADAPRLPVAARARFAEGVAALERRLASHLAALGFEDPSSSAGSMLAEMVGALSLARAEPDLDRSTAILDRSNTALKRRLRLESR